MIEPRWSQFAVQDGKRKRASFACSPCHVKKIKCDLELRTTQGYNKCSHCASNDKQCLPRPSRRDRRRLACNSSLRAIPPLEPNQQWNLTPPTSNDAPTDRQNINEVDMRNIQATDSILNDTLQTANFTLAQSQLTNAEDQAALLLADTTTSTENIVTASVELGSATLHVSQPERNGSSPMLQPCEDNVQNYGQGLDDSGRESGCLHVSEDELRPLFVETYFEYCYTWCPILSESTVFQELRDSALLDNAIATLGTNLQPPVLPHEAPSTYYDRACKKLYSNEEPNLIPTLKAIMLLYWWSPQAPSPMNRNSSWWWTSMVIKHAQQAGIHNDFSPSSLETDRDPGLHRRIWWTVFSRERLTAICQGKPCMIFPEDCSIPELSIGDFPNSCDKKKAEVFIYWVRLCTIVGRIARELSRSAKASSGAPSFPTHLARELIEWHRSLPPSLQLPFQTSYTLQYDRDIHQLHLCYLATVVVLHFTRPLQTPSAPKALTPAIVAASCIARTLKEVLMRREIRRFMPIICWYSGMAFTALLQGSKVEYLYDNANSDLRIITTVMKQLKDHWGTAKVYDKWFEKLRSVDKSVTMEEFPNRHMMNERSVRPMHSEESAIINGINWQDYFPFLTAQTTPLAEKLLNQQNFDDLRWQNVGEFSAFQFHDLIEEFENWGESGINF